MLSTTPLECTHMASTLPKRAGSLAVATLAIMVVYYLLTRHAAHTFGALPYLLILACPLAHLFGHRHRHGNGHAHETSHRESPR